MRRFDITADGATIGVGVQFDEFPDQGVVVRRFGCPPAAWPGIDDAVSALGDEVVWWDEA